jgi:hypothetical protein
MLEKRVNIAKTVSFIELGLLEIRRMRYIQRKLSEMNGSNGPLFSYNQGMSFVVLEFNEIYSTPLM